MVNDKGQSSAREECEQSVAQHGKLGQRFARPG